MSVIPISHTWPVIPAALRTPPGTLLTPQEALLREIQRRYAMIQQMTDQSLKTYITYPVYVDDLWQELIQNELDRRQLLRPAMPILSTTAPEQLLRPAESTR